MKSAFYIASDHGGFALKSFLVKKFDLSPWSRSWEDLGPSSDTSVDYPDFAKKLCQKTLQTFSSSELLEPCGVLICGSGVGVSIAANRFSGIRAVLGYSQEVAKLSREHNASNIICFGERLMDFSEASEILKVWLSTTFEGGRHQRRINAIDSDTGAFHKG